MRTLTAEIAALKGQSNQPQEDPDFVFAGVASDDPRAYLKRVENWMRRHPSQKFGHILRQTLEDDAYAWFRKTYFPGMSYELFKIQFSAKYDSAQIQAGLKRQLYGTEQGRNEDACAFITTKWSLFARLQPEASYQARVDTIIGLLRPSTRFGLRGQYFNSLEHLVEIATQVESDLIDMQRSEDSILPRVNPSVTDYRPPRTNRDGPPAPCHFCQGNHYNRDCPNRAGNVRGAEATAGTRPHVERLRPLTPQPQRMPEVSNQSNHPRNHRFP